jgi:site-specific recombinase XerD
VSTPESTRSLDACGRLRSTAAEPGYLAGRRPSTKGRRFTPDPYHVEDLVKLLNAITPQRPGPLGEASAERLRALVIVMWRTGMRISEALALEERDLERRNLTMVIRHGKGDRRRIVAMDEWGWRQLDRWLELRKTFPFGQVFCVLHGPTAGRAMHDSEVRRQLSQAGKRAGLRRRVNPHALRHTHAVELWREGVDLFRVQKQLGHARLDVTGVYLQGIAPEEILSPITKRAAPMMPVETL